MSTIPCLYQALAKRGDLHDYALPTRIISLEQIPRTAKGEPDQERLAELAPKASLSAPPRNDVEARVQQVFASILGLPQGVTSEIL